MHLPHYLTEHERVLIRAYMKDHDAAMAVAMIHAQKADEVLRKAWIRFTGTNADADNQRRRRVVNRTKRAG